jgi:hypothetical protein
MKLAIFSTIFCAGLAVTTASQADVIRNASQAAAPVSVYERDLAMWTNNSPLVFMGTGTAIDQDSSAYDRDLAIWTGAGSVAGTAIAHDDADNARALARKDARPDAGTAIAQDENKAYVRDLAVWTSSPVVLTGVSTAIAQDDNNAYERDLALWYSYGLRNNS